MIARRTLRFVALALLVLAPAAGSQETGVPPARLDLVAAVQRALQHHPSTAAARAARDESAATLGEAGSARYPALRLAGTATRYQEPALVTPLHGFKPGDLPPFNDNVLQGTATASYTLFDGGARGARIVRARALTAATDAALGGSEQALVGRVVDTYLQALTQQQILAAHDSQLEALRSELSRVRQLFASGRAARVEILRVEAALARSEAERVRASTALDLAERDLARLITAPAAETQVARLVPAVLRDSTMVARDRCLEEALALSPAVAQAHQQEAAARAGATLARGALWPDVRLVGNYNGWSDASGHDTAEWNAGLQLAYPLFTGGATRSGIRRADAGSRAATEKRRLVELQVAQDVDRALAAIEEARARVASLTIAVARSTEVVRVEKMSLAAGSGTQTDYLNAEAELLAARASLAEARHAEIAARAELARVAGALDPAWLTRNLEMRP